MKDFKKWINDLLLNSPFADELTATFKDDDSVIIEKLGKNQWIGYASKIIIDKAIEFDLACFFQSKDNKIQILIFK